MGAVIDVPRLLQPVLGCPYPPALAEFYRRLLRVTYRAGDGLPREDGSAAPEEA